MIALVVVAIDEPLLGGLPPMKSLQSVKAANQLAGASLVRKAIGPLQQVRGFA